MFRFVLLFLVVVLNSNALETKSDDVKFTITVEEITDALKKNHTNPLAQLICDKIITIFNKAHISIDAGSLVYDDVGDQLEINSDCSHTVWIEQGWETTATLKPDTSLTIQFGVHALTIIVDAEILADCNFGVSAHLRLREGVHDPFDHHKCKDIATETTKASVGGDMKLQTNISLMLKPRIIEKNKTYSIAFTPTVIVRGTLAYFHPTASSDVKIFGIDIKFIEDDINKYIENALQKEVSQHQVQKEFAKLQTQLQVIADKIWPSSSAVGSLPGITTDLLMKMKGAVHDIIAHQNKTI